MADTSPVTAADRRAAMLDRIREATGFLTSQTPRPDEAGRPVRQVATDDPKRFERWGQLARKNGMAVERCRRENILAAVDRCLEKHTVTQVLLAFEDKQLLAPLTGHLLGHGLQVHHWGEPQSRELAYRCEVAVTDARLGLADTGALLVWSDPGFGRAATLTIPIHVVLLPVENIVADLVDALLVVAERFPQQLPSNIVIINGPSKTADIEMNLVTGVHGPKYLYVVVVDPA